MPATDLTLSVTLAVLVAALIGALWLKEGFSLPRLAGAASVVAAIAALKL